MDVWALQLLGLVLNIWACGATEVELDRNVTGILGEAVVLRCQYTGSDEILRSQWTQKESSKNKPLGGYHSGQPFTKQQGISVLGSPANLTVSFLISSLEDETEYRCGFVTFEDILQASAFLTVLVRPHVHMHLEQSTENGTHYQTVSCSALSKPPAVIGWLVNGSRPSTDMYSVVTTTIQHPNRTATRTSMIRFPSHLPEVGEVTCAVSHPTLSEPVQQSVKVQLFVFPVTIEMSLTGEEGAEHREVTCSAAGGRPAPNITWELPGDTPAGLPEVTVLWDKETDTATVTSSLWIQPYIYEGETISCTVIHPKYPHKQQKSITLPTYNLSSVRVVSPDSAEVSPENKYVDQVVLEEGQRDVTILLEVAGTVPHYQVTCSKENGSLPADVEVTDSGLCLKGPVKPYHAGLYNCQASYYSHRSSVLLGIVVNRVFSRPTIKTQAWLEGDYRFVECSASDSFPAANVSWGLPAGLSGNIQSNSTFQNGTHSVTTVLQLPGCLTQELTVECVVQHPALADAEARPITLPACVAPDITVHSSTVWVAGVQYTEVECTVVSVGPAAQVLWRVEGSDNDNDNDTSELTKILMESQTQQSGPRTVHSQVRVPTSLLSGRDIVCFVEHPALKSPERRVVLTAVGRQSSPTPPVLAPVSATLHVSLERQKSSWLWLAVCEFRGDAASVNMSWILPENNTQGTSSRSGFEGGTLRANATYEFPLSLHEGDNLTCLAQNEHGLMQKTVRVPQYYISSLRVLNKTTLHHWPQSDASPMQRMALQPNLANQRILLKAFGNVPEYNITCDRSDGSAVRTEGRAIVFPSKMTQHDTGLYTCNALFYHHSATVLIQVEITNEDFQFWVTAVICFSSATAVILILVVSVCIFCRRNGGDLSKAEVTHKKRESLAALTALIQDPCSPELKKSVPTEHKFPEYPGLIRYSIVIDVKTTV